MHKKYVVKLNDQQRLQLTNLISTKKASARKLTRAHVLLRADVAQDGWPSTDETISEAFNISLSTVQRIRQQFVEEGLEATLGRRPKRRYGRKLEGEPEAYLEQLIYHNPPDGKQEWTIRSLTEKILEVGYAKGVSQETVRRTISNIRKKLKRKGITLDGRITLTRLDHKP